MSLGSDLLTLQDIDLELERQNKALNELPILAELAKKRSSYTRLKSEATKLFAERKDAQIAVEDLEEAEKACLADIETAQSRPLDAGNYRQMQDLEVELSLLAKRLEKIEFERPSALAALDEARAKETKLLEYIKRFEAGIVADTRSAREQATAIKEEISAFDQKREHLFNQLPADAQELYTKASLRFKGMGVEKLQGHVPSVCRTSLQPASMDQLRRATDIAECPYCHRILVMNEGE